MAKQSKQEGNWSPLKLVGIALAVVGVIIAAYSAYTMLAYPSGAGVGAGFAHRYNGSGAYPGGYPNNQTQFNYTGHGGFVSGFQGAAGPYRIAIGVLMLLLGIATYKYADLKLTLRTNRQ